MTHPIVYAKPPDKVLNDDSLFDDSWELKDIDAIGDQATFDYFSEGETDEGLRITVARGDGLNGDEGNDIRFIVVSDLSLGSPTAEWDPHARTLTITRAFSAQTFNVVKRVIDALSEFSSEYFGGAGNGSEATHAVDGMFGGGTPDLNAWVEVNCGGNTTFPGLFQFGTAVPSDNDEAEYSKPRAPAEGRILPKGMRIYTIRTGTADISGNISLWTLTDEEYLAHGGSYEYV